MAQRCGALKERDAGSSDYIAHSGLGYEIEHITQGCALGFHMTPVQGEWKGSRDSSFSVEDQYQERCRSDFGRRNLVVLTSFSSLTPFFFLTIRQRPGVETFRYWQEGPGYDRNLDQVGTVLAAIDYVHRNPVRRGLAERHIDWQWSRARWYDGMPYDGRIRVPTLEKLPAEFLVQAAS